MFQTFYTDNFLGGEGGGGGGGGGHTNVSFCFWKRKKKGRMILQIIGYRYIVIHVQTMQR